MQKAASLEAHASVTVVEPCWSTSAKSTMWLTKRNRDLETPQLLASEMRLSVY